MNWLSHLRYFIIGSVVAIAATAASTVVGHFLGAPLPSLLEFAAVFTSFSCTFLFVLQTRQAYLWGAVTTLLYTFLFFQYGLPGSGIVQVYLMGALVYGFFRWGPDGDTRPVTTVRPLKWWGAYAVLTGVTYLGAVWVSTSMGTEVPPFDSAILALSILAQWLLDNKKLETWGVWIVINVIAVPVYWTQGLSLVSAQYVLFLVNAVWALFVWYKSMPSPLELAIRQGRKISDHIDVEDVSWPGGGY